MNGGTLVAVGSLMSTTLELRIRPAATTDAPSLVEAAYRALKTAIRENVYPPGHQAAEPEIAEQLGMSRTPVHEAIIRLQEEGLVQVLPRRGVLICPISADDIREIYDVLIAVEGSGGRSPGGVTQASCRGNHRRAGAGNGGHGTRSGKRRPPRLGRRR